MNFIEQCKAELMAYFGLNAQQLQAEHLLLDTDTISVHLEFHAPSETVSVYSAASEPVAEQLAELPLPEQYIALRQALKTNADLFNRSLLRLYIDNGAFGLVMDCSPLNCQDGTRFIAALQELLVSKQQFDSVG